MNNLPKSYDQLDVYIREINKYKILTPEEELSLARELKETGDPMIAAKLINANLRFVVKIAYQYKNYGFKISDLIQEGNYGLVVAVKKFDIDKGYRLITYAVWWIKAYIKNYIISNWSLIKIGTTQNQKKLFFKLKEEMRKNDILQLTGKDIKLLADKFDVKDKEIIDMNRRLSSKDFQLDTTITSDSNTSYIDILSAENPTIEAKLIYQEQEDKVHSKIREYYKFLTDTEKIIYTKRLMTDEPKTLQELGEELGVSRERVRQIEVKIKQKIKKYLEKECDYDIEV